MSPSSRAAAPAGAGDRIGLWTVGWDVRTLGCEHRHGKVVRVGPARRRHTRSTEQKGRTVAGDPAAATEGWSALIQVVRYDERWSRDPDLELAVVMKGPSDAFTLRRVSLAGGDLRSSLPLLLDANPADLRGLGRDRPIQVEDQAFDRAEDALDAAHAQPPLADPEGWIPEAEFRSLVENDPDILDALAPRAERDGSLGHNVGVLAGFAGFLAVVLGGVVVGGQFGLYTPERQDTLWDNVLGVGLFCLAGVVAVLVYRLVVRLFARAGRRRDMRSQ
jgi:hypothetical protein